MAILAGLSAPSRERQRLETRAWLRTVGRPGPESWVWPVAAAGWALLVWGGLGWYPLGAASMAGHHHAGTPPPAADAGPAVTAGVHLLLWIAMVAATMLPLVAQNLRIVGLRSSRARRTRATLDVAAGWALVWLAAGMAVSAALVGASAVPHVVAIGVVCAAAIAWQFTAIRRVALARCHRTFAPPLGATAGAACVRFGMSLGRDCLLTCWPSMILMTVAGHQLPVVAALAWLSWRDLRRPHDSSGVLVPVAVLVAAAVFAALVQT